MKYLNPFRDTLSHLLWKYQEELALVAVIVAGMLVINGS